MGAEIRELEGRPHWVVPVVMLKAGTFAGSMGPVLYPPDTLAASSRAWNGKPIVVHHPTMLGGPFADNPTIYNAQKIGVVFNVYFDGTDLRGEAWIDKARAASVDWRIAHAIETLSRIEVSTGLIIEHDGRTTFDSAGNVVAIAQRLIPDHLAVLPDMPGACSIAHGCGLLVA